MHGDEDNHGNLIADSIFNINYSKYKETKLMHGVELGIQYKL
jgi:hypothetical protein